jgi:hypothetical protein
VRAGGLTTVLCLAVATSVDAAGAPAESAPRISVSERGGTLRRSWPVTLGVPLPKGWLAAGSAVHVRGARGPLLAQSRALAEWRDGSVRWLLVDFQADLQPRETREFQLQGGASQTSASKVVAEKRGGEVTIDTGVLRLLAGTGSGGLFRLQSIAGKRVDQGVVGAEMVVSGRTSAAGSATEVVVEDKGPLRASVVLRGAYGNGFEYQLRLEAFAGQPYVRLLHTFINGNAEPITPLERLSVHVPIGAAAERTYTATLSPGGDLSGVVAPGGVVLGQIDAGSLRRDQERRGGRLAGWFELRAGAERIGLDVPFFWQEFPEAVRLSARGLTYDLWSSSGQAAAIGVGAAKTHEFYLVFGRGGELPRPALALTAFTDPVWTAASGALLNAVDPHRERSFITGASEAFERFVRSVDTEPWDEAGACAEPQKEVRRVGFYGMLNWGDWNFRGYHDTTKGCDAWGNQEYDLTQALGLLFAATGGAEVWQNFVAAARHFAEVDRIHHLPQHPEWVGMNHPKNPRHFSFEHGGVDLGHTWVEGMFTYYFLTGEPRARAAGVEIADYLVRRLRTTLRGNPRQFGWPALALAAAFEATGVDAYRRAALEYARLGIGAHRASEKIGRDWKLGILADGVSYVHAITADPALRAWLTDYAAGVLKAQAKDVRYYPAVAYVGRLTGSAPLKDAARAAAGRILFGDWGKPFTIGARVGFRILSLLDEGSSRPSH